MTVDGVLKRSTKKSEILTGKKQKKTMFLFLSVQFAEKLIRIRYDRAVQKIRIQKEPKKRTQQQFCKRLKKNPVVSSFYHLLL